MQVVRSVPFETTIPADATSVDLWFRNFDSLGCEAFDSQDGENYRFEVQ